jgi:hypothetical protein
VVLTVAADFVPGNALIQATETLTLNSVTLGSANFNLANSLKAIFSANDLVVRSSVFGPISRAFGVFFGVCQSHNTGALFEGKTSLLIEGTTITDITLSDDAAVDKESCPFVTSSLTTITGSTLLRIGVSLKDKN